MLSDTNLILSHGINPAAQEFSQQENPPHHYTAAVLALRPLSKIEIKARATDIDPYTHNGLFVAASAMLLPDNVRPAG